MGMPLGSFSACTLLGCVVLDGLDSVDLVVVCTYTSGGFYSRFLFWLKHSRIFKPVFNRLKMKNVFIIEVKLGLVSPLFLLHFTAKSKIICTHFFFFYNIIHRNR